MGLISQKSCIATNQDRNIHSDGIHKELYVCAKHILQHSRNIPVDFAIYNPDMLGHLPKKNYAQVNMQDKQFPCFLTEQAAVIARVYKHQ